MLPESFAVCEGSSPATGALSRAALLFVGATASAACASEPILNPPVVDAGNDAADQDDGGGPVALYGPAVVDAGQDAKQDATSPDADSGGPVALYGPAVVDAGQDAKQDATSPDADSGGPVALYGPAVVDSGDG